MEEVESYQYYNSTIDASKGSRAPPQANKLHVRPFSQRQQSGNAIHDENENGFTSTSEHVHSKDLA